MKVSARNVLPCTVAELKRGAVNAEILLDFSDSTRLVAIITEESVRTLGLKPGVAVLALIKSSFIVLAKGDAPKTSARNTLPGMVVDRKDGAVNSEIVLDVGGGRALAAIITKESAENLNLRVGDDASALIKASHIILAID